MKKLIVLSLLFFVMFSASGQITITSDDLPQANRTFLVANDSVPSISLNSPSTSWQLWDYSSLLNHYPKVADYGVTSSTPYANDFPSSNAYTYGPAILYSSLYGGAPVDQTTNGYMFWDSAVDGFWAVGWMADSGPFAYEQVHQNPPELLIGTPATYGTVFNNNPRWELPLNNVSMDMDTFYIVNRNKTLTADAWGELITPYDTFSDVLRIHEYVVQHDSIRTEWMGFETTFLLMADTSNIYTYMAKGIGYPVAIVQADKNNVIQTVEYLIDSLFSVAVDEIPENSVNIRLYPNPTTENINIELPSTWQETSLVFYDLNGRQWLEKSNITVQKLSISIAALPVGIYCCRFRNQDGMVISKKIIKR